MQGMMLIGLAVIGGVLFGLWKRGELGIAEPASCIGVALALLGFRVAVGWITHSTVERLSEPMQRDAGWREDVIGGVLMTCVVASLIGSTSLLYASGMEVGLMLRIQMGT